MRSFNYVILCMILTTSAWASALQVTETAIPANFHRLPGPQAIIPCPMDLVDGNPDAVRLSFYDPPFALTATELEGQSYQAVRMDGEGSTLEPGVPDLPRITRLIMVSAHGQYEVRINGQSYHIEQLNHPVSPVQPMEGESGSLDETVVLPNPEIYNNSDWYPENPVMLSTPATLRDIRFVTLIYYPVQVNPVTGEIRIYDQLEVAVENVGGAGENELQIVPESISPDWEKLYSQFVNYRGSPLDELPLVPGKQLIICEDEATVLVQAQSLVDWRRRKGIDCYYATITDIGGNNSTSIYNYINGQYAASNGTLESVCLFGDADLGTVYPYLIETSGTLDNGYGSMGGGPNPDPIPDIGVGRLPAQESGELTAMVQKSIRYESDPFVSDTTWFRRGYCAAHTGSIASNPSMKEFTRQIMLQHGMDSVYFSIFNPLDAVALRTRINQGVCVFNHRLSWISEMGTSDLNGLTNNRKLPFVMSITCATGSFSGGGDQLSEEWVRRGTAGTPVGGIGCVGMSGAGTHVAENNAIDGGAMHALFTLGVRQQGVVLAGAKLALYKTYVGHDQSAINSFCAWANLMGDPAVELFTKVPRATTVSYPDTIYRNTNNVPITVTRGGSPIEGALVGLLKGTETFSRGYTAADGTINLSVSTPTTGDLLVTVTREDMDSYLDTIRVVSSTVGSLSLSSTTVDDDNSGGTIGNSNGVLNPGETIDLNIRLQNLETGTVSGITANLASTAPGVVVTGASRTYPNISSGGNALPSTPFRFTVGQVFNAEPIALLLTTTSSAGTQVIRVDFTPAAANVAFVSSSFPDGNNRLDPGDSGTFNTTFNNSGSVALASASGILRSLDAHVTVNDSVGSFGAVGVGANGSSTGNPFNVTASVQTVGGYSARMLLVITDTNGFRDSVEFNQTIGVASTTTPTGPDAYGYYCYDITETQPAGSATAYQWIEIAPSPGTRLNLNDGAENQDGSVVVTLPWTFVFYGQSFTEITISSNGWLAFGDYEFPTHEIYDGRNYPIPGPNGPPNQVAAYWDDLTTTGFTNAGVYVYNDVSEGRYVVEWRARGLCSSLDEVFEIVLLNPAAYPSPTGDGKIWVQYNTYNAVPNCTFETNDNDYATIGIQNADHSIGLQYAYWNVYAPTAATISAGRAIMYTTDITGNAPVQLGIVDPNGGESWYIGGMETISWVPGASGGNVSIELSRNGVSGPWTQIVASTPNDGAYDWQVTAPRSSTCRMRITPLSVPSDADTSNGDFAIAGLTLLSPNGGETLYLDSNATATWIPAGFSDIRIELSRFGVGGPWELITSGTPNDGSHTWAVTGPGSSSCRLKITSVGDANESDTSESDFSIASINVSFAEDFEGGGAGWTHSSAGGQWVDQWHLSTERPRSGANAYKCGDTGTGDYAVFNDARLVSPVISDLPTGSELSFWLQMEAETSAARPDCCYDGGIVELSADGGAFAQIFPEAPGYNKTFRYTSNGTDPVTGPMPGLACYSGLITVWRQGVVDLSGYSGQDIQLRFRFGSDQGSNREGWYVDDITIYNTFISPPVFTPTALTIRASTGGVLLQWAADGNTDYRIYSGDSPDGPFDTLEGTSVTNSFTIPGGAVAFKKFYIVVGWDGN